MNKRLFIFLFPFLLGVNSFAQVGKIDGKITDRDQGIPFLNLILINNLTLDSLTSQTDLLGEFGFDSLDIDSYTLIVEKSSLYKEHVQKFDLTKENAIHSKINMIMCGLKYPIKPCPQGNTTEYVIRISPNVRVNYNFKNDEARKKYEKKNQKNGYLTLETEGQTVLTGFIDNEAENEKIKRIGLCGEGFFCTKHKVVYE